MNSTPHAPQSLPRQPAENVPLRYLKADGTGNDFVVILDLDDESVVTADDVRAWCNRQNGVGADGLLRIVRRPHGTFFMDYRNADGTLAETCGNGLRVVAHVLRTAELIAAGKHTIETRGGDVSVLVPEDGDITVDMGTVTVFEDPVSVACNGKAYSAIAVTMPNPHAVAVVDAVADLGTLHVSPTHIPTTTFAHGTNYEFIELRGSAHIGMRVFERGVGETLSCGSGACAAAVVAAQRQGLVAPWTVQVDVPGGTLHVTMAESGSVQLTGPAQITGDGVLERADVERNQPDHATGSNGAPEARL